MHGLELNQARWNLFTRWFYNVRLSLITSQKRKTMIRRFYRLLLLPPCLKYIYIIHRYDANLKILIIFVT